jgi:hypothetical protein
VTAGVRPLRTRPLLTLSLAIDALVQPGGPPGLERRIGTIAGGDFSGERMTGTVLPGGSDWQVVRGDGTVALDARVVLRTADGALVAMTYTGLRHGPPDVIAALQAGEEVDPARYYFRIAPAFATSDPRYAWLNRILAIGTGHRLPAGPVYAIHEVL